MHTLRMMLVFVQHYWLYFFFFWWAVFLVLALIDRANRAFWIAVPVIVTAIGFSVSVVTTITAYDAADFATDWTGYDRCPDNGHVVLRECRAEAAADQQHFASFVGENIIITWWNAFADTVAWFQCLLFWLSPLWLIAGAFLVLVGAGKIPPRDEQPKRDIMRV